MPYRPVQWARQTVEGRQIEADGSRLINFYAVQPAIPEEAKVPVIIQGTPGVRRWARIPFKTFTRNQQTVTSVFPGVHGMIVVDTPLIGKHLFGVANQFQFFDIKIDGALPHDMQRDYDPFDRGDTLFTLHQSRIYNFTTEDAERINRYQPQKLVTDGRRVGFVARRSVKIFDPLNTTNAVADPGFITVRAPVPDDSNAELPDEEWVDMEWMDGFWILAARGGQIFHSEYQSAEFDQLDFAYAEANPDEIVGLSILNRRLFVFGRHSIEQWHNAPGTGSGFTFRRDLSYVSELGCFKKETIARNEDAIYFVGSDLVVYRITAGKEQRVSTESVELELARANRNNLFAFAYTEEGHRFYCLHISNESYWVFDQTTGFWHERQYPSTGSVRSGGPICAVRLNGKTYVGSRITDNIFQQTLDFGADWGVPLEREAVAPVIHTNLRRERVRFVQVEIPLRSGGTHQDSIRLDWSDDGRATFQNGDRPPKALDTGPRIRWNALGQFQEGRNFRLRTSAKRRVDILGCYVDTQAGQP